MVLGNSAIHLAHENRWPREDSVKIFKAYKSILNEPLSDITPWSYHRLLTVVNGVKRAEEEISRIQTMKNLVTKSRSKDPNKLLLLRLQLARVEDISIPSTYFEFLEEFTLNAKLYFVVRPSSIQTSPQHYSMCVDSYIDALELFKETSLKNFSADDADGLEMFDV